MRKMFVIVYQAAKICDEGDVHLRFTSLYHFLAMNGEFQELNGEQMKLNTFNLDQAKNIQEYFFVKNSYDVFYLFIYFFVNLIFDKIHEFGHT